MDAFSIRVMTHSDTVMTVATRSGCPFRQLSPKKSPFPWSATTASFPCSETTQTLTLPSWM